LRSQSASLHSPLLIGGSFAISGGDPQTQSAASESAPALHDPM
jgi:hypothetical protein